MRVGLLGCGWIQDFHARAIRELGGEVAAVANHRLPTAEAFAERHGIDRVTTDWRAVATDPGIDAVVVGTPNALHAEQSVAALEAGRHVLVEKPMAVTVAECDAMIAAASGSGASLMVAHCWRFHDAVRALRDRIAGGELGEIVKTRGYGVHAGWGPDGWFTDPALAGGGALLDMGVHAIDTARFLLGDPAPTQVRAVVGTRYGSYDVDDDAILLIDLGPGDEQPRGVRLVAAPQGGPGSGDRGVRDLGLRADLPARGAGPGLRTLRAAHVHRADAGVPGRHPGRSATEPVRRGRPGRGAGGPGRVRGRAASGGARVMWRAEDGPWSRRRESNP